MCKRALESARRWLCVRVTVATPGDLTGDVITDVNEREHAAPHRPVWLSVWLSPRGGLGQIYSGACLPACLCVAECLPPSERTRIDMSRRLSDVCGGVSPPSPCFSPTTSRALPVCPSFQLYPTLTPSLLSFPSPLSLFPSPSFSLPPSLPLPPSPSLPPSLSLSQNPWIYALLAKLLANDPAACSLLARNPFAGGPPPARVRARLHPYEFARPGSPEARAGQHWVRGPAAAEYVPAVSLAELRPILRRMGWV